MGIALVVIAVGQLMLWGVDTGSGAGRFVPGLLLAGVASGVLNAALGRESVASVPPAQAGLGSGANNTARYLGSALGVTVVSVVAAPSGPVTAAALVDGLEPRRPGHGRGLAGRCPRRAAGGGAAAGRRNRYRYTRTSATCHEWSSARVRVARTYRIGRWGTASVVSWPVPAPSRAAVQCVPSELTVTR